MEFIIRRDLPIIKARKLATISSRKGWQTSAALCEDNCLQGDDWLPWAGVRGDDTQLNIYRTWFDGQVRLCRRAGYHSSCFVEGPEILVNKVLFSKGE